jgi:hypothetical protein
MCERVEVLIDGVPFQIELVHTENSFLGTEPSGESLECVVYPELTDVLGLGDERV